MAISLEELALGALEGGAGPWTLAVGAGALAVALAAGSSRPLRRMATTGAVASVVTGAATAQRATRRRAMSGIGGWLGGWRQGWRDLVAEARSEYEAGRSPSTRALADPPIILKPEDRAEPPLAGASEAPTLPEIAAPEASSHDAANTGTDISRTDSEAESQARATRDRRGRFVRRQPPALPPLSDTNGVRAE